MNYSKFDAAAQSNQETDFSGLDRSGYTSRHSFMEGERSEDRGSSWDREVRFYRKRAEELQKKLKKQQKKRRKLEKNLKMMRKAEKQQKKQQREKRRKESGWRKIFQSILRYIPSIIVSSVRYFVRWIRSREKGRKTAWA